jgi:hypothetical protein
MMPAATGKQPDQKRIVASLAKECHMPVGEMAALYEHERAELASGALITNYLHIFATRKVLEILHQRDLDKEIAAPGSSAFLTA